MVPVWPIPSLRLTPFVLAGPATACCDGEVAVIGGIKIIGPPASGLAIGRLEGGRGMEVAGGGFRKDARVPCSELGRVAPLLEAGFDPVNRGLLGPACVGGVSTTDGLDGDNGARGAVDD